MPNADILKKAMDIHKRDEYIEICVTAHICPKCGSSLQIDCGDYDTAYYCTNPLCSFRFLGD